MGAVYIAASDLVKMRSNAGCCDCCLEADNAPEDSIWTIWNRKLIYCPKCAAHENIGPENHSFNCK